MSLGIFLRDAFALGSMLILAWMGKVIWDHRPDSKKDKT